MQFNPRDYLLALQAIFTDCVLNAFCGGHRDERLYSPLKNGWKQKQTQIYNMEICEYIYIYICVIVIVNWVCMPFRSAYSR